MPVYAVLDLDKHEHLIGLFVDAHTAIGAALEHAAGEPVVHPLTTELHAAGYVLVASARFADRPNVATLLVKRVEVQ